MIKTFVLVAFIVGSSYTSTIRWYKVEKGLDVAIYEPTQQSDYGDSKITILKIDPALYNFNLMHCADGHVASEWSKEMGYSVVVNAGMFDHDTKSMGYMQEFDSIYTNKMNSDRAVLALNRKGNDVPKAQIIDLIEDDWTTLSQRYNSFLQSIRMVSSSGRNMWSQQNKMWSVVVIAIDKDSNVLLIHCRSPYTMHDFINIMLDSPLNIKNMMYLEGGPEATMYLTHNGNSLLRVGSYETGFMEHDKNKSQWDLYNIIGVTKKR